MNVAAQQRVPADGFALALLGLPRLNTGVMWL